MESYAESHFRYVKEKKKEKKKRIVRGCPLSSQEGLKDIVVPSNNLLILTL